MRKSGLNDSDKVFVTVAMWLSAVSLFATAITLPMLPDNVTIVYKTVMDAQDFYSKYNNLLTVLGTLIPAIIIIIVAALKNRNVAINNFPSIMIFCIMLSACMGGVTIYGITRQIQASGMVRGIDDYIMIALTASVILSAVFTLMPAVIHSKRFAARATSRNMYTTFVCETLCKHWAVGAFGYLVVAIACTFVLGPFTFIPLGVAIVADILFICLSAYLDMKHAAELKVYDLLES